MSQPATAEMGPVTLERHQQDAIRGFAEARATELLVGSKAIQACEDFGLPFTDYEVFDDTESPIGGGFKRFVLLSDESVVLHGLSWMHKVGVPTGSGWVVSDKLLLPNNDISIRTSVESLDGQASEVLRIPAIGSASESYPTHLQAMFLTATQLSGGPVRVPKPPAAKRTGWRARRSESKSKAV